MATSAAGWRPEDAERLRPVLESGVRELGLDLSDTQINLLMTYLVQLGRWNQVYNLTAVRDPDQMLKLHVLDSLSAIAPLRRHTAGAPIRLLDVGSGGGLPGVVLAICSPEIQVSCVDTVAKKAAFIQQVAASLRLPNLKGIHARVESLRADKGQGFDVVCSRAFASLVDFTTWSRSALNEGAVWMAMKGKHPQDELDALPPSVSVFHVEQLQVPGLDAERCIIWMKPSAA